ncbi:hypothetical protein Tco_1450355, partial [Tanacetum coccineum]
WDRSGVVVTAADGCEGGGSGDRWPEFGRMGEEAPENKERREVCRFI